MLKTMRRSVHLMACVALLWGAPAGASPTPNDNFKFCYSPAYPAWRNFLIPCIDGVIDGNNLAGCPPDNGGHSTVGNPEQGWAPGFRYTINNGGGQPDVVFLALANGDINAGTLHLDR